MFEKVLAEYFEHELGTVYTDDGTEICYIDDDESQVSVLVSAAVYSTTDGTGDITVELASVHEGLSDFIASYNLTHIRGIARIRVRDLWKWYDHGKATLLFVIHGNLTIYFQKVSDAVFWWNEGNETERFPAPTLTTIEEYIAFSKSILASDY
ncbi:MAG: hypothetical protein V4721_06675 [Bacteroidota bacterium]